MASGELCDRLFDQFRNIIKSKSYKILVHKSENIEDVLKFQSTLTDFTIDFIAFAFDGRINQIVEEVRLYFSFVYFLV